MWVRGYQKEYLPDLSDLIIEQVSVTDSVDGYAIIEQARETPIFQV